MNEENFNLRASLAASEIEYQHSTNKEVDNLKSQLTFKVFPLIYI